MSAGVDLSLCYATIRIALGTSPAPAKGLTLLLGSITRLERNKLLSKNVFVTS